MTETQTQTSRSRRPTTRTTTGCQTCRQRRVKCDEAKPSCKRCQRAAVDCSYKPQIKWPRQGARMGNNRSRRHPARSDGSSPTTQTTHSPLNGEMRLETFSVDSFEKPSHEMMASPASSYTTGVDFNENRNFASWIDLVVNHSLSDSNESISQGDQNSMYSPSVVESGEQLQPITFWNNVDERASPAEVSDEEEITPDDNTSLVLIPAKTSSLFISSLGDPYQLPSMTSEDSMLFRYYVTQMCPRCIVRNGFNENYRQVVLPLVNKSNILLRAILAVTANRVKLQDGRFQTIALRHQAAVLQGLQHSLSVKKPSSFSRLEMLSTILMLCFYEIYNPGPSAVDSHGLPIRPWMTHSGGVRRLLEQGLLESHDSNYEKAIVSFLSQYFASRSVLAFTSLSPLEDQSEVVDNAQYWLGIADRPAEEINPFAGCSNEMLKLILVITLRLRQVGQSQSQPPPSSQQTWATMMAKKLFAVDQMTPTESRHGDASVGLLSGHSTSLIKKTSEAFRWAALVLLGNFYPKSDLAAQEQTETYLDQLGEIIDSGLALPRCGALGSSSYVWPYFITGCHLHTLDQQTSLGRRIKQLLSRSEAASRSSRATSGQILHVLEETWSVWDGHGAATCASEDSFLWERAMLRSNQVLEWV